ncbi:GHKL domain-containing protein [Gemmiger formicilis]|nr:GHKL domain-containing protein [Gemmiger formicilis]
MLGNLLDNAIEACLKLEEAKRRIEVSVLRDEAYADSDAKLYVSIINTSLPVHIEKDCIATTKPEPHLHGFGLPCAKELLRRNNAFTRWIIMTVRSNSALNGPM